jgi:predicted amidohydrolase
MFSQRRIRRVGVRITNAKHILSPTKRRQSITSTSIRHNTVMSTSLQFKTPTLLLAVMLACPIALSAEEPETSGVREISVAIVQFESAQDNPQTNFDHMARLARKAVERGSRWVLFHEVSLTDHTAPEPVPTGRMCEKMIALAKELDCFLSFGIAEKDKENVYIAQVFVGPQGFIYRYRKTWLWEPLGEWRWYDPGTGPDSFEFDGVRATCFICSDGVSQRCISKAAELKPSVVIYPNSRPGKLPYNQYQRWAKEIGAPILLSNRAGGRYIGGCAVFDSVGTVTASANQDGKEEILFSALRITQERRAE